MSKERETSDGRMLCDCPECRGVAEADTVDNGVGLQQCGPYVCECGWVQPASLPEFNALLDDETSF